MKFIYDMLKCTRLPTEKDYNRHILEQSRLGLGGCISFDTRTKVWHEFSYFIS